MAEHDEHEAPGGLLAAYRQRLRHQLLTRAEELLLAEQIAAGQVARQLGSPGQTAANDAALQQAIEAGEQARASLIAHNLRLVVSLAVNYQGQGLDLDDLIQEGSIGLLRATITFDVQQGNRFSTYAIWWIRQTITRALADQSRSIRLPVHIGESYRVITQADARLSADGSRAATLAEIAAATGFSVKKVSQVLAAVRRLVSLDEPARLSQRGLHQEGTTRGELLADPQADTETTVTTHELQAAIHAAVQRLPPRERQVLELRFGLIDGQVRTLEEIGAHFDLSRERIRQIEADALRKLRHPSTGLRDFLPPA